MNCFTTHSHWKKYGIKVDVTTHDCTSMDGCNMLLNAAAEMGEIAGIWNLAVCLNDAMFENQNKETFVNSLKPKAHATRNLDELSRPISSRFQVFDQLLMADETIVSSWCLADKMSLDMSSKRITATVLNVLGNSDASTVDPEAVLGDLGMDSLVTLEIQQVLARDYDVQIKPSGIKQMKLRELEELVSKKLSVETVDSNSKTDSSGTSSKTSNDKLIVRLNESSTSTDKILIIPGLEVNVTEAWLNIP